MVASRPPRVAPRPAAGRLRSRGRDFRYSEAPSAHERGRANGEGHMPDRVTLPALTSLRFFLAALVVLRHSNGLFGIPPSFAYLAFGQSVSGFFVLSGFLLTYRYPALDGPGTRRFLVSRVVRIWPLHAL